MIEFAAPSVLWALPAVSIPIVIHLLHRRRFRRAQWAAMAFLVHAERRARRRVLLQKLLVLALRVVAVLLLVILFARPYLSRPFPGLTDHGASLLVLMDDSASMSQRDGDSTVFDRSINMLVSMAERAAAGGAPVSLTVHLASRSDALFHADRLGPADAERLRSLLSDLEPTALRLAADMQLAQMEARARSARMENAVFYVLTDLRAADWARRAGSPELAPPVAEALRRLQELGRVVLVDAAPVETENVGITDARLAEPLVYANTPAVCRITIENRTAREIPPGTLDVLVDGRSLPSVPTPAIPGGEARQVPVSISAPAGYHGLEFRFEHDEPFQADNRAYLALESRQRVPVLIVEGDPGLSESEGSCYYLKAALEPEGAKAGGIEVDVRYPWALKEIVLSDYAVIFLSNVADPGETEAAALRYYVEGGGGLVIFLGDRVSRQHWNESLLEPESGVLPARLRRIVDLSEAERPARMGSMKFSDPLLEPFKDWEALFGMVSVTGFWQVEPLGNTEVLASFDDGDFSPAILLSRIGRGAVLLVTTSADDEWNDWARSELGRVTYVSFVHRAVEQLAGADSVELNLEAGAPLVFRLDPSRYEKSATLRAPRARGGSPEASQVLRGQPLADGSGLWLTGGRLLSAGLWKLELKEAGGPAESVWLAVNMPAAEGDLERVPAEAFGAAALSPDLLRVVCLEEAPVAGLGGLTRQCWQLVAAILLVVLVLESALAYLSGNPRAVSSSGMKV